MPAETTLQSSNKEIRWPTNLVTRSHSLAHRTTKCHSRFYLEHSVNINMSTQYKFSTDSVNHAQIKRQNHDLSSSLPYLQLSEQVFHFAHSRQACMYALNESQMLDLHNSRTKCAHDNKPLSLLSVIAFSTVGNYMFCCRVVLLFWMFVI